MKFALALCVLAGAQTGALAQTVLESDFTISVPTSSGQPIVESSTLVPLLAGTCFDWHLKLGKTKGVVLVTETYHLPAPPEVWDLAEGSLITVSDDGRSAVTILSMTPEDGWISSGWCVSDGDPPGPYRFDIEANGAALASFDFEIRTF